MNTFIYELVLYGLRLLLIIGKFWLIAFFYICCW